MAFSEGLGLRKLTSSIVDSVWLFETTFIPILIDFEAIFQAASLVWLPSVCSTSRWPSMDSKCLFPCSPNLTSATPSGSICALHSDSPRRHSGVMIALVPFPP